MRRMVRAIIALAALALAGVMILPAAPAHAAPPEILVSTDGVNFAPATAVDLFDDLDLIVPGDTMDAQLWIRNNSPTPALVRVAVTGLTVSSPVFGSAVTLSSTLNASSYASTISALTDCDVVVQTQTVGAGNTVRVDFEVSMASAASGLTGQGGTGSLGFIATAHDPAAGPFPTSDGCTAAAAPRPGASGSLAWTGSEIMPTVFVAVALLGLGLLFTLLRRRRRDDHTQES
jgi:LPXTG-motif cell wall-anchored protein